MKKLLHYLENNTDAKVTIRASVELEETVVFELTQKLNGIKCSCTQVIDLHKVDDDKTKYLSYIVDQMICTMETLKERTAPDKEKTKNSNEAYNKLMSFVNPNRGNK